MPGPLNLTTNFDWLVLCRERVDAKQLYTEASVYVQVNFREPFIISLDFLTLEKRRAILLYKKKEK